MKTTWLFVSVLCALSCAVVSAQEAKPTYLSDKHVQKNIQCVACHGENMAIKEPTIEQCQGCHNPDELAKKTAPTKPEDRNPHQSPHYGTTLECTNCHRGHEEPEVFCNQCHQFNFVVK